MVNIMWDVIIIGGGPAGAFCAYLLARNGCSVVLLEKGEKFRYKSCAGGVTPRALSLLPKVPEEIIEDRPRYLRVFADDVFFEFKLRGEGILVYRSKFDQWLRDLAESEGAVVKYNTTAKDIVFANNFVEVKHTQGSEEGKILVGAFGYSGHLFKKLGIEPPPYSLAVQREFKLPEEDIEEVKGAFETYFGAEFCTFGYAWIFPKSKSRGVSVGIVDKEAKSGLLLKLDYAIKNHPILSKKLRNATLKYVSKVHVSASVIPYGITKKIYGDRFILVGDAAGIADPISWEGMGPAIISSKVATDVILKAIEENKFDANFLKSYYKKLYNILLRDDTIPALRASKRVCIDAKFYSNFNKAMLLCAKEDKKFREIFIWTFSRERQFKYIDEYIRKKTFCIFEHIGIRNALKMISQAFLSKLRGSQK